MDFNAGRVRRGEAIAGGGGIVLLAVLLFLPWFARRAPDGRVASLDGWHALTTTRWILLVTIVAAVAVVLLTASRRAPAIPVVASMLACVLGVVSSLLLLFRIIGHPGLTARAGVYVGLLAALAVGYGGYLSLRTERGSPGDPRAIETVALGHDPETSAGETESTSAGRPAP